MSASLFAVLAAAAPAAAADTLYWSDQGSDSILYAPADGSAPAAILYSGENAPDGIALDPSTGRIYWVSEGTDEIRTGLLAGGTAASALYTGEADLDGLAVDPVGKRIYWASGSTLRGAPLAGGGTVDSVYTGQQSLQGVAADEPAGNLYWTLNFGESGDVMRGPLGGGTAASLYTGEAGPSFVAVDSAASGVWWTTVFSGVRGGTTGGAAATTLYDEHFADGIVADTAAGRLYWAVNMDGPSEIHSAPIAGGGTVAKVADGRGVRGLALLRTPLNTKAPEVSPTTGTSGTDLSCTEGTWSIGVPGAFVYRAPTTFSYQWRQDGSDIAGATAPTHKAATPGKYVCVVTATNQAGATPAVSNEAVIEDPPPPPPPPPPPEPTPPAPTPTPRPVVTLSPDVHDFGSRPTVDDSPPHQTFSVENTGDGAATITSLRLSGTDAGAFDIVFNGCGDTLAAGAACPVEVVFNPSSPGSKAASLDVASDGGDDSSALMGVATEQREPEPAPEPKPKPKPKPKPRPADLDLHVANDVVLHSPAVPTRCRTSRHTRLRRCRVKVFTLGGKLLGTGTQSASSSKAGGRRTIGVRIHVNRRGRHLVAPALGGVPVRLRAVGHLTDGRVRRAGNHTRLFAERHHLVPPFAGIFVADQPILLARGKRFLAYIATHARRVDVVRCDGHAAKLPPLFIRPLFASSLSDARARVACRFLRRHGMTARFVRVGHSNQITRQPGRSRFNPATWPPDRRSGVTLIRH